MEQFQENVPAERSDSLRLALYDAAESPEFPTAGPEDEDAEAITPEESVYTDDPVRVYQGFATVDLISGGRAEIMAGRGSFIESFPLFGHNLELATHHGKYD